MFHINDPSLTHPSTETSGTFKSGTSISESFSYPQFLSKFADILFAFIFSNKTKDVKRLGEKKTSHWFSKFWSLDLYNSTSAIKSPRLSPGCSWENPSMLPGSHGSRATGCDLNRKKNRIAVPKICPIKTWHILKNDLWFIKWRKDLNFLGNLLEICSCDRFTQKHVYSDTRMPCRILERLAASHARSGEVKSLSRLLFWGWPKHTQISSAQTHGCPFQTKIFIYNIHWPQNYLPSKLQLTTLKYVCRFACVPMVWYGQWESLLLFQAAAERIQACFQGRMVREQAGAFELHKLRGVLWKAWMSSGMFRQWFGLLVTVLRLVVNGLSSPN